MLVIAAAAVAVVVTAATLAGWLDRFWPWFDGFARTPGFGALAAFVAAVVAYQTAAHRLDHDRDVERKRREDVASDEAARRDAELEAAHRDQRWQMLMWVYENIEAGDPEMMLRVSRALLPKLKGELELTMLDVLLGERLDSDKGVPDDGGRNWEAP